jgi:phosphocarrier protein HPr
MASHKIILKNESGLHARPAGLLAKAASAYASKIQIQYGDQSVNAKSVLSVMSLGLEKGSEIVIQADGADADLAITNLVKFIETDLAGH